MQVLNLPDHLLSRSSFTAEFPLDRPAWPALLTVPLAALYGPAADVYHRVFDAMHVFHAPAPVISVGNIVVGGTGKTPCTIALAQMLADLEPALAEPNAVAILSRGFGRATSDMVVVDTDSDYHRTGDEPLLIKQAVPKLAVLVHVNRNKTAVFAVSKFGSKILLLDDGFQNRRLARDLDLVLLDGAHPFGNGKVLPAGPLREGIRALERASAIIGVGKDFLAAEQVAKRYGKPFAAAIPKLTLPTELSTELSTPVYLLTSIARPSRFYNMLIAKGLNVLGGEAFGDHHRFTQKELARVANAAQSAGAHYVLTTGKDRTRIRTWPYDIPVLVADLRLDFVHREKIEILLRPIIQKALGKVE
ncbi:MAG TPA: tetraacyldisaccharide 4'-kinase [bacterium]